MSTKKPDGITKEAWESLLRGFGLPETTTSVTLQRSKISSDIWINYQGSDKLPLVEGAEPKRLTASELCEELLKLLREFFPVINQEFEGPESPLFCTFTISPPPDKALRRVLIDRLECADWRDIRRIHLDASTDKLEIRVAKDGAWL